MAVRLIDEAQVGSRDLMTLLNDLDVIINEIIAEGYDDDYFYDVFWENYGKIDDEYAVELDKKDHKLTAMNSRCISNLLDNLKDLFSEKTNRDERNEKGDG